MTKAYKPDGTLGRGIVTFQQDGTNGEEDFANVNSFEIATEIEKAERYGYRGGPKTKLDNPKISQDATITFVVDDPLIGLMRIYLGSNAAVTTTQVAAVVADEAPVARLDKWVPLANRNIDRTQTLTVKDVTDVTTFVEYTDYELDAENGLIYCFSEGSISESDVLHVSYTCKESVSKRLDAGQANEIKGLLRFYGDPLQGVTQNVKAYVTMSPSGSLQLIGDEFEAVTFEAVCLTSSADTNNSLYQYFDITNS